MVRFQHERVRGADAINDQFGDVPEIRGEADIRPVCPEQVTNRILRIMRNGERLDEDIIQLKTVAGSEQSPV